MRIILAVNSMSSLDIHAAGNVEGDEMIARSWQAEINRRDHTCLLAVANQQPVNATGVDYVIHFSIFSEPWLSWANTKNVLYMQNAFSPQTWPGGTIGMFRSVANKFDAYIFTSQKLCEHCLPYTSGKPVAVAPFAADPHIYHEYPVRQEYRHPVVFVGNNIRGQEIANRYLYPAIEHGLVIYGNKSGWGDPYFNCCRGKIRQDPDEAELYSSARICLNSHIDEHVIHDTINFRIYTILACGGFVISDCIESLDREFSDSVVFTNGNSCGNDELSRQIKFYLEHPEETIPYREHGRELVLGSHTFKHRMDVVLPFLERL